MIWKPSRLGPRDGPNLKDYHEVLSGRIRRSAHSFKQAIAGLITAFGRSVIL